MSYLEIAGLIFIFVLACVGLYELVWIVLVVRWMRSKMELGFLDLIEERGSLCQFTDNFDFKEREILSQLVEKEKRQEK